MQRENTRCIFAHSIQPPEICLCPSPQVLLALATHAYTCQFLLLPVHYFLHTAFDPATGTLSPEESHHALRALRLRPGDELQVGNGRGKRFTCRIVHTGKDALTLEVLREEVFEQASPSIRVYIAPVKHPARLEWFLEKATELGADVIVPLRTARTEKAHLNQERMQRVAVAAAKQSQRPWLPELHPITPLQEALQREDGLKLLAHCMDTPLRLPLREVLPTVAPHSISVYIGPEGDFTPAEAALATEAGCTAIHLGPARLRTETAGIFCVSLLAGMYR